MVNGLKIIALFFAGAALPALAQTPAKKPEPLSKPAAELSLAVPKAPSVAHYKCSPDSRSVIYFFTEAGGKTAGDYRQIYVSQTGDSSVSERSPWQLYSLMFKKVDRRDGTQGSGYVTGGPLEQRLHLKAQTLEGKFLAQFKDASGKETIENWKVRVTTSHPENMEFNGKSYSIFRILEEVDIPESKRSMKFEVWYAPSVKLALKTRLTILGQLYVCEIAPVDVLMPK
jgi:hypothetical protein